MRGRTEMMKCERVEVASPRKPVSAKHEHAHNPDGQADMSADVAQGLSVNSGLEADQQTLAELQYRAFDH